MDTEFITAHNYYRHVGSQEAWELSNIAPRQSMSIHQGKPHASRETPEVSFLRPCLFVEKWTFSAIGVYK